jgi:hypothetical protein
MSEPDAHDRFMQAARAHEVADGKGRTGAAPDKRAFQLILIDLEAAIPGLDGFDLGRAYGLVASCHHWLYLAALREMPFFDVHAPPNPNRKAGLAAAEKARKLLAKAPKHDRKWIDSLLERLAD